MSRWFLLGAALLLAVLFRLPPLLNADSVNSDGAIIGLQARHILDGEFSLRLWGASYQSSLDAFLAAVLFVFGGSSAFKLLLVPLLGMLAMVALAFRVVERHAGPWGAFFAVLPLVFATYAVNSPMAYVARQSLATSAVLAVYLLETAAERERPELWFAAAGVLVGLGPFHDTFFLVMVPALVVFAALRGARLAFAVPLVVCILFAVFYVPSNTADAPQVLGYLKANWKLLWRECLPFAFGTRAYIPYGGEWVAPAPLHALQVAVAWLFAGALFSGAALQWKKRVHALGVLGVLAASAALGGFLVSGAPFDMWSARYLAPVLWFAPFAVTPLLVQLGVKRVAGVLAAFGLSAAVSGWHSYGDFALARDGTFELQKQLLARNQHHGWATYWQAYRLSFLWKEDPLVAPLEDGANRNPEIQAKVNQAPGVPFIFHRVFAQAALEQWEPSFAASGNPYEKLQTGEYTVLIPSR